MKPIHRLVLLVALTLATWLVGASSSQAQRFYYPRPVVQVAPGASFYQVPTATLTRGFTVQPFTFRPSGYGLYSGQGISAIQPNVTVYRPVPLVTSVGALPYYRNGVYVPRTRYYGGSLQPAVIPGSSYVYPTRGLLPAPTLIAPKSSVTVRSGKRAPLKLSADQLPRYQPTRTIPNYRGPLIIK